jgi:hypothetical protein
MPMPMPHTVSKVRSRLRQRFFHANPEKDNCETTMSGTNLRRAEDL